MDSVAATKYYEEKERQESIEHRDALLAIASVVKTKEGEKLFRYLFKNFEVANLPDRGLEDKDLYEYLGFLRAGNSIYKLVCEADAEIAGSILSKLERERYEHKLAEHRIETGYADPNSNA
jgi:hypothetical protein